MITNLPSLKQINCLLTLEFLLASYHTVFISFYAKFSIEQVLVSSANFQITTV